MCCSSCIRIARNSCGLSNCIAAGGSRITGRGRTVTSGVHTEVLIRTETERRYPSWRQHSSRSNSNVSSPQVDSTIHRRTRPYPTSNRTERKVTPIHHAPNNRVFKVPGGKELIESSCADPSLCRATAGSRSGKSDVRRRNSLAASACSGFSRE